MKKIHWRIAECPLCSYRLPSSPSSCFGPLPGLITSCLSPVINWKHERSEIQATKDKRVWRLGASVWHQSVTLVGNSSVWHQPITRVSNTSLWPQPITRSETHQCDASLLPQVRNSSVMLAHCPCLNLRIQDESMSASGCLGALHKYSSLHRLCHRKLQLPVSSFSHWAKVRSIFA